MVLAQLYLTPNTLTIGLLPITRGFLNEVQRLVPRTGWRLILPVTQLVRHREGSRICTVLGRLVQAVWFAIMTVARSADATSAGIVKSA